MLNADLIRQRRLDLNMSNRQLAKALRVTPAVIRRLEEGSNHEWITLGEVARLAGVLSIRLRDMFSPELMVAPQPEKPIRRVTDLGSLLHEMGKLVPRSALCQALECSPDELDEALEELAAVLTHVGMTIHATKDSVTIAAAADSDTDSLKALIRSQLSSRGLTITDGNLLVEVAAGMRPRRKLNNYENTALQRLRKAGMIENDRAVLSEAARISLLLE